MLIFVCMTDYINNLRNLKEDLINRLSIGCPKIHSYYDYLEIELEKYKSIKIVFKPAHQEYIKGTRPDYYWTDNYDVDKYYRYYPNIKCLQNFTELANVVFTECCVNRINKEVNK